MKLGKRSRGAVALAAVVVAAATGCSTKAPESQRRRRRAARPPTSRPTSASRARRSRLGVLTDLTGVFAALGKDITNANELFWEENQVCDTYDVELDIQDTGYVPQQGVQLYSGMKDSVLAMQQTIGSPINTALAPEYEADQIVNFPSAWSKTLTEIPGTGVVGATYDVEIANGYGYLFEEGLLKEGDTVGHIYFEGEYGANGLAGTQAVAEEMGLEVDRGADQGDRPGHERPDHPVQGGRRQPDRPHRRARRSGVRRRRWRRRRASTCRSSAATRSSRPACSAGPAADVAEEPPLRRRPRSRRSTRTPSCSRRTRRPTPTPPRASAWSSASAWARLMKQVLDAACENGDLTRAGRASRPSTGSRRSTPAASSSRSGASRPASRRAWRASSSVPADVPGGATVAAEAFEGEFAEKIAG